MLIRCEKCSTLYELDEGRLPPQGAPVQCSKCQFVFKAYPPSTQAPPAASSRPGTSSDPGSGASLEGADAPLPSAEALVREGGALAGSTPIRRISTPAPSAGGGPRPVMVGEEQQYTADGRPIRKVPFPTGDPTPPVARTPPARTTGRGPGGKAPASALRWVVALVVVALLAAIAMIGWRVLASRGDRRRAGAQTRLERSAPCRDAALLAALPGSSPDQPQAGTAAVLARN